jgi:hypothetical protein
MAPKLAKHGAGFPRLAKAVANLGGGPSLTIIVSMANLGGFWLIQGVNKVAKGLANLGGQPWRNRLLTTPPPARNLQGWPTVQGPKQMANLGGGER